MTRWIKERIIKRPNWFIGFSTYDPCRLRGLVVFTGWGRIENPVPGRYAWDHVFEFHPLQPLFWLGTRMARLGRRLQGL